MKRLAMANSSGECDCDSMLHDQVLGFFPARQDFEKIGLLSVKNSLFCNI
jgi:hypothetical protein